MYYFMPGMFRPAGTLPRRAARTAYGPVRRNYVFHSPIRLHRIRQLGRYVEVTFHGSPRDPDYVRERLHAHDYEVGAARPLPDTRHVFSVLVRKENASASEKDVREALLADPEFELSTR